MCSMEAVKHRRVNYTTNSRFYSNSSWRQLEGKGSLCTQSVTCILQVGGLNENNLPIVVQLTSMWDISGSFDLVLEKWKNVESYYLI